MFDLGWTEMALIAVVAVIVIGPKELPKVMREMGYWVSRARNLSRTFMDQLEEMSRQSGIDEVRKEVEAVRHLNPTRELEKAIDPDGLIDRQMSDLAKIGSSLEPPLPQTTSTAEQAATAATPGEEPPALPAPEPAPVSEPGADEPVPTPRGSREQAP